METIATIQIFRYERMTETESGCAERTGRHWIDAAVVTVKESSTFEPQIENFNHSFAYIIMKFTNLFKSKFKGFHVHTENDGQKFVVRDVLHLRSNNFASLFNSI
jgi:hypothetical protein